MVIVIGFKTAVVGVLLALLSAFALGEHASLWNVALLGLAAAFVWGFVGGLFRRPG